MSNNFTKSKTAKVIAGFVGLTTGLMMVGGVALTASASSVSELTAQINSLLAQITSLQSQLGTLQSGTTTTTTTATGYTFTSNLKKGDKGADVLQLQKVLNSNPDTVVATTGVGSAGNETNYFGNLTKAAVIKFQNKYASDILTPLGLSAGTGYVGPSTRAKLNSMTTAVVTPTTPTTGTTSGTTGTTSGTTGTTSGTTGTTSGTTGTTSGTTTGTVATTGTGFTVTAGTQPANSLAVGGASRVPFTTFTLTNNSSSVQTLNNVTVERTGLLNKAVFSGVVLLDGKGKQLGNSKTLNSNYQATIEESVSFQPGQSMTFTVAGNMISTLGSYAGQVGGLNVTAISTGATVTGTLPITGSQQTMNGNLAIGTVTGSTSTTVSNPGNSTQPIGTSNYVFSAFRVTAGSAEDVTLKGVRFNQSGSASSGDLSNVLVYVDGTSYPTTVSSDGKYYSATFGSGVVIKEGFAKDIYIKGDVSGSSAAGRTVQFDIYKNTDLNIVGNTYGYGITAGGAGTITSGTPSWTGSKLTVTAGSVTSIAKDTTVSAQNIALNVPSQVLGGFTTNMKGEPITVQTMVFTVASTSGSGTGLLTNVSLYDQNGAVVAGPVDAVYTSASVQTVTFTDSVTIPVGQQSYVLKGKVASTIGNGTQYTTTVAPASWSNITGETTGDSIDFSSLASFTLNPVTVKSGALAITASPTPAAQVIVAGGQQVPFTTLQFDASQSGEDLQFSSVTLALALTGTGTGILNTCQLYDGTTALNTGSNVPTLTGATQAAAAFTFDNALTVPKGTIKDLTVKCNIPSGTTGNYQWNMTTLPTVTGVTSGSTIVATGSATGKLMTIGAGSLHFSTGASSPSYSVATAGTTGVVAGVYKLRPSNDNVTLTKLGLQLDTASSSSSDLTNVTLWMNGNQIGSAVFTGSNSTATSTLNNGGVILTKDVDTLITVKADLANIGTGQAVIKSGDLIKINYLNAEGTGVGSGLTTYGDSSSATAVSGVRVFKSAPTIAQDTLPSTGIADGKLLRFKVTADAKGSIGLDQFKFTIATSTLTSVTGLNMFGYTDALYSNAISGVGTGGQVAPGDTTAPAGTFTITPSSIIQVPAGQTYYFEVRGTVAGALTGASATTKLLGDSAYPLLATGKTMGTATALIGTENLVWSPNSTTTAIGTDVDWTNGYGVDGFPSSGISQTRGL